MGGDLSSFQDPYRDPYHLFGGKDFEAGLSHEGWVPVINMLMGTDDGLVALSHLI